MSVEGSRFTLVEAATLSPGVDFITKSGVGPFIDTGYTTSFADGKSRSRVYLSLDSVREIAEQAGLFDPYREMIEQARDEGYEQGYNVGIKENFNADLTDALDRLGSIADSLSVFRPDIAAVAPLEATGTVDAGEGAAVVEIAPKRAKRTAGQGNRTARQQGRADVPAGPTDESTLGV